MLHVESISWRAYFKHYEFFSASKSHNFIANFKGFKLDSWCVPTEKSTCSKRVVSIIEAQFLNSYFLVNFLFFIFVIKNEFYSLC